MTKKNNNTQMKTFKYIAFCALSVLTFSSCMDELKQGLDFNAAVDLSTAQIVNDTIFVKKDSLVTFNFTGNPSNIVFYSGEVGKDYKLKGQTEIASSTIDSCFLKFDASATGTNAVVANTLSLRISDRYTGLIGSTVIASYLKDSLDVRDLATYGWADSTAACGFPIATAVVKSVKVNMMNYLSKRICLQFRYQTNQNTQVQAGWALANLKFVIYPRGQKPVEVPSSLLNFRWIDVLYSNHYSSTSTGSTGCWNKTNLSLITMSSSSIGKPLNEDYLINDPYMINSIVPNTGEAVKTTMNNLLPYTYKYTTAGVYTATFVAVNQNFIDKGQEKIVKLIVKVQ